MLFCLVLIYFYFLGLNQEEVFLNAEKHWLLGFYVGFPILIVATAIIVAWN